MPGGKPGGREGKLVGGGGRGDEVGGLCLGDGDSLILLAGGREAGDRASAGLTLMEPSSGLTGGLGLTPFTSGFLTTKFSGMEAGWGMVGWGMVGWGARLTKDRGSAG